MIHKTYFFLSSLLQVIQKNHTWQSFSETFSLSQERDMKFQMLHVNKWFKKKKKHIFGSVGLKGNLWLSSAQLRTASYQYCYTGINWWNWALWRLVILTKHCSGPRHSIRHPWPCRSSPHPRQAKGLPAARWWHTCCSSMRVSRGPWDSLTAAQTRLSHEQNPALPESPLYSIAKSSTLVTACNTY